MPYQKDKFTLQYADLTKATDVDDNVGRSVPVNMNYSDENYLTKDTGYVPHGTTPTTKRHSQFIFRRKDGAVFDICITGTKMQLWSKANRNYYDIPNSPTFTQDAQMGYVVYNNELWFGNGVESLFKWTGSTFTEYAGAPKGNILEIFEDRLAIAGVEAEPFTIYYSNVGIPQTFSGADLLKPLGTDKVTGLVNFYGILLIFKESSIWKMTFVYDQVVSLFVPKLEIQSKNYGACTRGVIAWAENDVWFFSGREVRSIGFKDQLLGTLGVNRSVISEAIKETLALVKVDNYSKCAAFYHNRRYHLSVPINSDDNDTTFVCHLLHASSWTKYVGRAKARFGGAVVDNDTVYTNNQISPYGIIKWKVEAADASDRSLSFIIE